MTISRLRVEAVYAEEDARGWVKRYQALSPAAATMQHVLVEPRGDGCCLYTCIHEIDPAGNAPAGVARLLDARRGNSTQAPRKLVNWFALRKPLVYCAQVRALAEVR